MPLRMINTLSLRSTADTPLAQTKLGELGAWLGRRQKSPQAVTAAVSRGQYTGACRD